MNKILSASLLLLGSVLAFTGCKNEEDDLFGQSAAERLNEASDLYSSRLTHYSNGWAMQYYPTTEDKKYFGNGYLLLMDFKADHSAKVAMKNVFSGNKYMESTSAWEVITDNGPVLTFNTSNECFDIFSAPENVSNITGGRDNTGTGVGGDYEFVVVDAPESGEYMMLKGKKRGTYNLLTPMEDSVSYSDYLDDVQKFQADMFPLSTPNDNRLVLGDSVMIVDSLSTGIPSIYPEGYDQVAYQIFNPFLITKRAGSYYIRFRDAFTLKDGSEAQDFKYDSIADYFQEVNNPNASIKPVEPDLFFSTWLNSNHSWSLVSKYDLSKKEAVLCGLSDDLQALYTTMKNDLLASSAKYRVKNISYLTASSSVCIRVSLEYTSSGKTRTVNLDYSVEKTLDTDGGVTFANLQPVGTGSTNFFTQFASFSQFLSKLADSFTVKGAATNFVLERSRLTSKTNPSSWLVVKSGN